MTMQTTVIVWSEETAPCDVYSNSINATIMEHLNEDASTVARTTPVTRRSASITTVGSAYPVKRRDVGGRRVVRSASENAFGLEERERVWISKEPSFRS